MGVCMREWMGVCECVGVNEWMDDGLGFAVCLKQIAHTRMPTTTQMANHSTETSHPSFIHPHPYTHAPIPMHLRSAKLSTSRFSRSNARRVALAIGVSVTALCLNTCMNSDNDMMEKHLDFCGGV